MGLIAELTCLFLGHDWTRNGDWGFDRFVAGWEGRASWPRRWLCRRCEKWREERVWFDGPEERERRNREELQRAFEDERLFPTRPEPYDLSDGLRDG